MRAFKVYAVAAASALVLAGCGPGEVKLSHDWTGSEVLALATVAGQRVVIGFDVAAAKAVNLAVIASAKDDDDTGAPVIARLADGRWIVSVPRTGGATSRLYQVDAHSEGLDGIGAIQNGRTVVPVGAKLATVGSAASGGNVIDATSWRVTGAYTSEVAGAFAAGAAPGTLCVAENTDAGVRAVAVHLDGGPAVAATTAPGAATAIACRADRPLVVVNGPPADRVSAKLAAGAALDTVTVSGATGTAVMVSGGTVLVAVSDNNKTTLIQLDLRSGAELKRVEVTAVRLARGIYPSSKGPLLIGDEQAAVVDLAAGSVRSFALPGPLLTAPRY